MRELADARIKAVILPRHVYTRAQEQHLIEEFREAGLPVLSGADLSPRVKGKIGVADTAAVEEALAAWDASQTVYSKEKKARKESCRHQLHGKRVSGGESTGGAGVRN